MYLPFHEDIQGLGCICGTLSGINDDNIPANFKYHLYEKDCSTFQGTTTSKLSQICCQGKQYWSN